MTGLNGLLVVAFIAPVGASQSNGGGRAGSDEFFDIQERVRRIEEQKQDERSEAEAEKRKQEATQRMKQAAAPEWVEPKSEQTKVENK